MFVRKCLSVGWNNIGETKVRYKIHGKKMQGKKTPSLYCRRKYDKAFRIF